MFGVKWKVVFPALSEMKDYKCEREEIEDIHNTNN